MEETLVCEACQVSWKRQRSRGRKPRLCPTCLYADQPQPSSPTPPNPPTTDSSTNYFSSLSISKVVSTLHPKSSKAKELMESTQNGSKWKCPACGHIIQIYVAITDIPTHRCTPNMVSVKICERID